MIGRANITYELAERTKAVSHGGMGLVCALVDHVGLASEIDASVKLLKAHRPYLESDHVLNFAYNALCGGATLDDIEARRNDRVFLDGIGAQSLPDPTTAGDFCRRFDPDAVMALQDAINQARLRVWATQPAAFFAQCAVIDADASIIPDRRQDQGGHGPRLQRRVGLLGVDGQPGQHQRTPVLQAFRCQPAVPRRSADLLERAVALVREAGFTEVLLRGDTDYALTANFDRWDRDGVHFVFGYDARPNLVAKAETTDDELYHELVRQADRTIKTKPRRRPRKVKDDIVRDRKFKVLRTAGEDVCEFDYRPRACKTDYRVIALRKDLSVERGEDVLFHEYRWFFYITNLPTTTNSDEVVMHARRRCDQENLIAQLKGQVRALHAPVNTLVANWAYMVMAGLAWTLKAWCALLLPVSPRWAKHHNEQRRRLLTMDFRTFRAAFIDIPCQIVTNRRQVRWRVLAWNPWLNAFFRLADAL